MTKTNQNHRTGYGVSPQWYQGQRHKEAVARKYEKVQMLRTLVEMWEQKPYSAVYVRQLKVRLRSAETQLKSMA